MDKKKNISSNLKRIREILGYTQEKVANDLKITRVLISYYENGDRNIPPKILKEMAEYYNTSMYDLMQDNPEIISLKMAFRTDKIVEDDQLIINNFKQIINNYELMMKNEY